MEKLTRLVASVEASPFQAIVYGDLGTPEELCMALKGDTLWISEFLLVDCRIETPPAKPDCSRILVLINPKPGVFSYYPRFPHLSVIYLSDPVYDQVRLAKLTKGASVNRLIRMIHIPRPSKSQLVSILVNKPLFAGCTRPLLDYTMDVLVQIFFHATRDVNTLYRQARIIIPIAEDIFYGSDEYTLKDVYSELSVRIRNLYLDYGRYSPAAPGEPGSLGESLPTMTKFLIIASYLASTVPPEKDVQLFSTASTQRKKAKKVSQKASREFVGLSWFPLPRLLAIFKAICKEFNQPVSTLYTQIASLVSFQYLETKGKNVRFHEVNLDNLLLKCNLPYDTVEEVAESMDFKREFGVYYENAFSRD